MEDTVPDEEFDAAVSASSWIRAKLAYQQYDTHDIPMLHTCLAIYELMSTRVPAIYPPMPRDLQVTRFELSALCVYIAFFMMPMERLSLLTEIRLQAVRCCPEFTERLTDWCQQYDKCVLDFRTLIFTLDEDVPADLKRFFAKAVECIRRVTRSWNKVMTMYDEIITTDWRMHGLQSLHYDIVLPPYIYCFLDHRFQYPWHRTQTGVSHAAAMITLLLAQALFKESFQAAEWSLRGLEDMCANIDGQNDMSEIRDLLENSKEHLKVLQKRKRIRGLLVSAREFSSLGVQGDSRRNDGALAFAMAGHTALGRDAQANALSPELIDLIIHRALR